MKGQAIEAGGDFAHEPQAKHITVGRKGYRVSEASCLLCRRPVAFDSFIAELAGRDQLKNQEFSHF